MLIIANKNVLGDYTGDTESKRREILEHEFSSSRKIKAFVQTVYRKASKSVK